MKKQRTNFLLNVKFKKFLYFLTIISFLLFLVSFTIIWKEKWNLGRLYGQDDDGKLMLVFGLLSIIIGWINYLIVKKKYQLTRWIIVLLLTLTGTFLINGILGLVFGLIAAVSLTIDGISAYLEKEKSKQVVVGVKDV